MTLSFACWEVYGNEKKVYRYKMHTALCDHEVDTGLSMPPERSVTAMYCIRPGDRPHRGRA